MGPPVGGGGGRWREGDMQRKHAIRPARADFWPREAGHAARIGPYRPAPSALVLIGARPGLCPAQDLSGLGRAFSFRLAEVFSHQIEVFSGRQKGNKQPVKRVRAELSTSLTK